jgi:hypothetical protein
MAKWQALKQASNLKRRAVSAAALAAFGLCTSQAALAVPVLSLQVTPTSATVGSSVLVNVLISGVADLFGAQFTLGFNPAVLQATGVSEGAFLGAGGSTIFISGSINNTLGSVANVADALVGSVPGVSGSGVLASLQFTVNGAGVSTLNFSNVLLLDSQLADIAFQTQAGTFTGVAATVPEPAAYALMGLGLAGLLVRKRLFA